jgi:hypothetical protein
VAVIYAPSGSGSGFIGSPGLLVTNYHVIRAARIADLAVHFPDNPRFSTRSFTAELVAEDPRHDLAVLRIDCDIPALRIEAGYRHANGHKVVAIGSPGNGGADVLPNLSTAGRLGPPFTGADGVEVWTLSADINPGNSGGPIVDEGTGQVVGVAQGGFTRTRSQAIAVPHPRLLEIVHRAESSGDADESRERSLHRARFCLDQLARIRHLTDRTLEASLGAAAERGMESAAAGYGAYNEFRSEAISRCSEPFTAFETDISADVLTLQADPECEPRIRLALGNLRRATAELIRLLREPVTLRDFSERMGRYRETTARARALAASASRSLSIDIEDDSSQE